MSNPNTFSRLLNKVHLGSSPDFLEQIPNNTIALTMTSPPYYDEDLYVLDDDILEFGWRTYEDYLEHLSTTIRTLLRITIPGGRLILVLSNTPQTDEEGAVTKFWPLNHDVSSIARDLGWELVDEIIWVKNKLNYSYLKSKKTPESSVEPKHDTISVYRKPGPLREGHETIKYSSVWDLELAGPIKKYNKMYPSFPNELVRRCIKLWSLPNDILLDPYAGSGQVCRIAIEMDRFCIGVEADEQWKDLWNDINIS